VALLPVPPADAQKMIQSMEITLIEKSGKRHELTLPDIEPVSADWLRALCEKFFGKPL
jgi:hypothetical protein